MRKQSYPPIPMDCSRAYRVSIYPRLLIKALHCVKMHGVKMHELLIIRNIRARGIDDGCQVVLALQRNKCGSPTISRRAAFELGH
jgi:hypothetical protein